MDFLLKFNLSDPEAFDWNSAFNSLPRSNKQEISFESGKAMLIGDPVLSDPKQLIPYLEKKDIGAFIRNVDGFYFLIVYYNSEKGWIISSGMFSILPVYHSQTNGKLIVSSSLSLIRKELKLTPDHQYFTEKALFNYPLFDRTPFNEVKVLSANSLLSIGKNEIKIGKHTRIEDYFTNSPQPWKSSLENMSDLFISCAKRFLSSEYFVATLTGGFDGRVITGLALSEKKQFGTYSYGSKGDDDVKLPEEISKKINVRYKPLILDKEFASQKYWEHAQRFVKESGGLGNFSRAHYSYALDSVLKDTNFLLTGNFGSEILRAMKTPGVMVSESGFDMFGADMVSFKEKLRANKALNYLDPELVTRTIATIEAEIETYLNSLPKELSVNQKFYVFVFEEVFRKYFGPEICVQRKKLNNRSPFLCFQFISELLRTEFAGANSEFREANPINRYHGQVLYAHILKKTYPALNDIYLDRGYKPKDFLNTLGMARIVTGQLKRKYLSGKDHSLPSYAEQTVEANIHHFKTIALEQGIFNKAYFEKMHSGNWKEDQRNYINMNSAAYYLSELNNA